MSWKKFTAFQSSPNAETYPTLPDDITWFRLFLGLLYGLSLGFRESSTGEVSINGRTGIMFGLNVITFIPILYLNFFLDANMDTYKNVNFVGVLNGLALMILVWTVFFSMIHEDEEGVISKALVTGVVKSIIQDGGVEEAVIAETQFESEF